MAGYVALRNRYKPTVLVPRPYGWAGSKSTYNQQDVPVGLIGPGGSGVSSEETLRTLAYEWLTSGTLVNSNYSNPPFTAGAAGRLHPLLMGVGGQPARILRGFIRRANWEAGDETSKARLYFMYNPEAITREYVSYLDQQALDPFNTIFQSGNLVAPPSILNFRFDLFFDRQTEAMVSDHPGCFVDYQFFDLVVRNVIPTDPNESANQLPDNGVMMVNPRDITVVFSPQLSVQGRPTNAQVIFEKFTHRMIPIRMRISLEMRVTYFGPMLDQSEYRMQSAQLAAQEVVTLEESTAFNITFVDIIRGDPDVPDQQSAANGANFLDAARMAVVGAEGANIVPVSGITGGVDKNLAPYVRKMIQDAAAGGVTLAGGGYRSSSAQAALRKKNGCPDLTSPASSCRVPTAPLKNGASQSEHTKGFAIDFNNCSTRSGPVYNWLRGNAGRYGLKNLPSESWHWSTTGK